jgi:hypothetical protein
LVQVNSPRSDGLRRLDAVASLVEGKAVAGFDRIAFLREAA